MSSRASLSCEQCPATGVVIYRTSATVTRSAVLPPAVHAEPSVTLEIRGYSPLLDNDSVRVTSKDPHWAVINLSVANEAATEEEAAGEAGRFRKFTDLLEELKKLQVRKEKTENYEATTKKKKELLMKCFKAQTTVVPTQGLLHISSTNLVAAMPELAENYGTQLSDVNRELRKLQEEKAQIEAQTEVVSAQLSQMGRRPPRVVVQRGKDPKLAFRHVQTQPQTTMRIELAATHVPKGTAGNGDHALEISYRFRHCCRWTPSYDLFATSTASIGETKQVVDLEFFGRIEQETGEDWKDVEVRLSTANLDDRVAAPPLPSVNVGFKKEVPVVMAMAMPAVMNAPGARMRKGIGRRLKVAESLVEECLVMDECDSAVAIVENKGLSTEFVVPVRMTLPSEMGRSRRVTVAQLSLEAEVFRYTVPSLERSAYVQAMIWNSSNVPLLACMGDVAAYLDGELVSHISIDRDVAPGDKFSASLGKDSSLRVDCSPLQEFRKEVGLISKTRSVAFEQTSTLRGEGVMKDTPIVVAAAVPVSKDAKIVVKLDDAPTSEVEESDDLRAAIAMLTSGKKSVLNKTTNHVLRLLVVPKGGQLQTKCAYAVEWPADKDLDRSEF